MANTPETGAAGIAGAEYRAALVQLGIALFGLDREQPRMLDLTWLERPLALPDVGSILVATERIENAIQAVARATRAARNANRAVSLVAGDVARLMDVAAPKATSESAPG